jgi:hypothetical protein
MSAVLSYPGVYIQELKSPVHTITGVATSITAFVGYTARGIDNRAGHIFSFADFERDFGGIAADSELSYAVSHFFDNGGSEAFVVRVPKSDAVPATVNLYAGTGGGAKLALSLAALSKGAWGNRVVADVDYTGVADTSSFNLTITDRTTLAQEVFNGLSADSSSANYCVKVLNDPDNGSSLVTATAGPADATARPAETGTVGGTIAPLVLDPTKAYKIKVSASAPASLTTQVDVTIVDVGDAVPTSILGLARMVERKVNAAIQVVEPGAAVRCVVNADGDGLRLYADFDPVQVASAGFDAVLGFGAGSSNSLLAKLGLTNADNNVGHYWLGGGGQSAAQNQATAGIAGVDGTQLPQTADLIGDEAKFTGIFALDRVDLFNLLCIPDATRAAPGDPNQLDSTVDPNAIYAAALSFFTKKSRRAFLLIDAPPDVNDLEKAADWKSEGLAVHDPNAAAFFPRLRLPDPLAKYKLRTFAPCGVMAGLYARIDATRGVWKAPAGVEATLDGVQGQVYALTDLENGVLNKLGLNCLRNFPIYGNVSWGGRTLVGSDDEGSEWKYVSVRRTALYIEESLFRGTKWVVFEPNDESLWAQIRLNVGAFMHDLYRQGAFQGRTPSQAYIVKCDNQTTTQNDIDRGVVNIYVAFAPLKPAEFVVIQIQQLAGQIQT